MHSTSLHQSEPLSRISRLQFKGYSTLMHTRIRQSAHTLHPYSLSVLFSNAASKQQHINSHLTPCTHLLSLTSLHTPSLRRWCSAPLCFFFFFFSAPLSKQVAHTHAIDTDRWTAVQHSRTHHRSHSRQVAACSMQHAACMP